MDRKKKTRLFSTIVFLLLVLGFFAWFLSGVFEGEKPRINLDPLPEFISGSRKFTLNISDMKRGLRVLRVSVAQGGRETIILEKRFPFKGLQNKKGIHTYNPEFTIDPSKLNLVQGRVDLDVEVWDYSRRRGGDGNLSVVHHKIIVDTIPPMIRAVSRMHYVSVGGSGLVVYHVPSDAIKSGLFVSDVFFQGFPAAEGDKEGLWVCFFAIPIGTKPNALIYLRAEDRAGNSSRGRFNYRIREKRFRTEKINISDRFLKHILPDFSYYPFEQEESDIEKFLKINTVLRKENALTFQESGSKTDAARLWKGAWLRLKNAANMAKFGDQRVYLYKGKAIDKQTHMGVDLASLGNSEVQAANQGRVIFANRLGIYGLTVVLDHGQGLASTYSHLSAISVELDQEVMKGDIIGQTGQTGLAGGDHLHFGVMVGGVFVNPIEWWDSHWIQDNISRKLALLYK
ncbi:MAG: M23 family metallopeptidase [Desulfobacterales bacterium]|nr:M23 family metallopeptidase [Desulfobacterales bacterium]